MSNHSENNTFNIKREQALRNSNLDFASNRLKNLERHEQQVPTPEPRRRLVVTSTAITNQPCAVIKGDNVRLKNELAMDQEEQAAQLVKITHHHNRLEESQFDNSRLTSHTEDTLDYNRLTKATPHLSPTGTPADEGVGSPITNVEFDDEDDEDHIRLAEGDDDELADEYYDEVVSTNHKLSIDEASENQLTNLSRQSMVPIHELIAYYQYIQNGDIRPHSLDRETNDSATTSRQSSSASQQTTRTRHSDEECCTVDVPDGTSKHMSANVMQPPSRTKRSTIGTTDESSERHNLTTESNQQIDESSEYHKPTILVEDSDQVETNQAPTLKAQVQDRTRLRANVVLELINSERDFVKHLKNVVEGYLHRARKHPEIFTAQQINTIFANIEQLYDFQRHFLASLEKCIDWSDLAQSQVGDCFLRYEKGFSVYHYYCNNHPNATSELQDLYSKSIFRNFFEECRLKQNMIDISLDGFLLTPIQKICKYPLQLNELLKNTADSHPDYQDVANALETMRNCANLANERKRRIEALADVMSFQEKVDNWFGPKLSETSSILVHSGEVSKMTSHTWSQGVQLHLFDHLLLYSKRDLLKRNSLILKGRICMDSVTEISDADEYKPRKSFKLYCSEQQKWFVFTTKNEKEKDEWIQAFERERNLVESDENEGFHITDRELGIARRTLLHRKRSRSARYRHQNNNSKRPDTAVVEQLEPDDPNFMINRTLSLPSCIHPSHVMNFVEDSRVVSHGTNPNSSTRKKNSSPNSNSRSSPMASSQHLASGVVAGVGLSELGDQPSGPTNWLRKMGSKKLTKSQIYQINGQTGHQQQQQQLPHQFNSANSQAQSPTQNRGFSGTGKPPVQTIDSDVDAAAMKYDELEKRHRDHMVSEQQARLYRLNNDLPPPPALYSRSLTPTPFATGTGVGGISGQSHPSSSANNNRPKSSPSNHHLNSTILPAQQPGSSAKLALPPSNYGDPCNGSSPSSHSTSQTAMRDHHRPDQLLQRQFENTLRIGQNQTAEQPQQGDRLARQPNATATFETELVLSSGRVVHVREDSV